MNNTNENPPDNIPTFLRDHFAGQVLAGLSTIKTRPLVGEDISEFIEALLKADAAWCYAMADAMLEARKVKQ